MNRVALIDASGDSKNFVSRSFEALHGAAVDRIFLFGGRSLPVLSLSLAFNMLSSRSTPTQAIVLVNGKNGRHWQDIPAEIAAADFLSRHKMNKLDFLQVYHGGKAEQMRWMAESIANMPGLFTPERAAPVYTYAPDPTAIAAALQRQIAL